MSIEKLPEIWLRGPIAGIPIELQPVAHALLQARNEIVDLMQNFSNELLWVKPAGLASPAFHLQHIVGVIDRLISYKNQKTLSAKQLEYLKTEGRFVEEITTETLVNAFRESIDLAVDEVKRTDIATLADFRGVGRQQMPSTVGGLLFHIAEHTMRHTGQLLVTVKVLKNWV